MTDLLAGTAVVISLIAIASVLVLANEVGRLRTALEPPAALESPIGKYVHSMTASALSGDELTLPPAAPALLLFVLRDCAPCEALLTALAREGGELRMSLLVIARADELMAERLRSQADLSPRQVIVDSAGEISRRFYVTAYPSTVVTTLGLIQQHRPASLDVLREFYSRVRVGGSEASFPETSRAHHSAGKE